MRARRRAERRQQRQARVRASRAEHEITGWIERNEGGGPSAYVFFDASSSLSKLYMSFMMNSRPRISPKRGLPSHFGLTVGSSRCGRTSAPSANKAGNSRPDLVAEFRAYLIEAERQLLERRDFGSDRRRKDLLVRWRKAVPGYSPLCERRRTGERLARFTRSHGDPAAERARALRCPNSRARSRHACFCRRRRVRKARREARERETPTPATSLPRLRAHQRRHAGSLRGYARHTLVDNLRDLAHHAHA